MFRILFLISFILSVNGYTSTLSDLRTEIRRLVRDTSTDTSLQKWSDAILNSRINWVQDEISALTFCIHSSTIIETTAGQREYTLPANVLAITRVSYLIDDTTYYRILEYHNVSEWDINRPRWEQDSSGGDPLYWYESRHKIGLDPTPSSTYISTDAIRVEFYKKANNLSSDSDVALDNINSLVPFHYLIIWRVSALCMYDEQDQMASVYDNQYFMGIQTLTLYLDKKPARTGHIEVLRK